MMTHGGGTVDYYTPPYARQSLDDIARKFYPIYKTQDGFAVV
jgi:hypothetical protein